ncbi:MAG: hypothetical protein B7Y36_10420 [Novosphingobium sp. 28-62-57]|uniref:hypothetical protein n=1 Tax=unclassified Novosphingobium TaxID=2644732 RepID=UPI000BD3DD26|nr:MULTISPECIES: hypothetical protein [unclassified Novosphingobium]OYW48609.1 MAG: hypothetical protein B7Z34_12840 [Novosphingobium sp. 12-62-10]OYZ10162.1 MAG: hypothetical protein B7Y36_10420 [Novosphingobium sp. 28-62-57]OZA38108.1 MAG: hypothetical protein B7X92_03895 [Novosphingobium sp. 17-62-9]HQS69031.1 hypothetical protein [Novosphingobium sp.]
MVGVLMLEVSPAVITAFENDRVEHTTKAFAEIIRSAHPGIVNAMPEAELLIRTRTGIELCQRHHVQTRRDIMILCLVHVMYGRGALDSPDFAWIRPILDEPPSEPDTRAYRIHCKLAEG